MTGRGETEKLTAMQSGLVSVTFRALSVERVVELASANGLRGIEWGGDVHAPHGDIARAREVGRMTREAGVAVACYGSYYRVAASEAEGLTWESVVETAEAMGSPCIRVWAGKRGSNDADENQWDAVVEDSLRIADLAEKAGIKVAYEYHGGTLTDSIDSTARLLDRAKHDNLYCLWQPINGATAEANLPGIEMLGARLHHAHVFHWWPTSKDRHALSAGRDRWVKYIEALRKTPCKWGLLEFVSGDAESALVEDARMLKEMLGEG